MNDCDNSTRKIHMSNNFILRIKEQETRLIFHEHDDELKSPPAEIVKH
jgi:hypothetical protein